MWEELETGVSSAGAKDQRDESRSRSPEDAKQELETRATSAGAGDRRSQTLIRHQRYQSRRQRLSETGGTRAGAKDLRRPE